MKFLIIICVLISVINCANFPSDIPRCKAGDTKCIEKAINNIFRNHYGGHDGLYLPEIDPLHVDQMNVNQDGDRPVNIKLYFKNIDFFGLRNANVVKVVGFERDASKSKFEMTIDSPRLEMIADYEVDGRVLLLPVSGKGKSNFTLVGNQLNVKFQATTIEKKGKKFAQIGDKFKFNLETKRVYSHLDNLFNGDKALGDTMNTFINENWLELFHEMRPVFTDAFKKVCKTYVNRIFQKLSYDDIWLD